MNKIASTYYGRIQTDILLTLEKNEYVLTNDIHTFVFIYKFQKAFGERLLIFVSAVFLHYMILRQLPSSTQERHTNQNTCLCQFVEMLLAEYFRNSTTLYLITDFRELIKKQIFKNVGLKKESDRKISSSLNEEFSFVST